MYNPLIPAMNVLVTLPSPARTPPNIPNLSMVYTIYNPLPSISHVLETLLPTHLPPLPATHFPRVVMNAVVLLNAVLGRELHYNDRLRFLHLLPSSVSSRALFVVCGDISLDDTTEEGSLSIATIVMNVLLGRNTTLNELDTVISIIPSTVTNYIEEDICLPARNIRYAILCVAGLVFLVVIFWIPRIIGRMYCRNFLTPSSSNTAVIRGSTAITANISSPRIPNTGIISGKTHDVSENLTDDVPYSSRNANFESSLVFAKKTSSVNSVADSLTSTTVYQYACSNHTFLTISFASSTTPTDVFLSQEIFLASFASMMLKTIEDHPVIMMATAHIEEVEEEAPQTAIYEVQAHTDLVPPLTVATTQEAPSVKDVPVQDVYDVDTTHALAFPHTSPTTRIHPWLPVLSGSVCAPHPAYYIHTPSPLLSRPLRIVFVMARTTVAIPAVFVRPVKTLESHVGEIPIILSEDSLTAFPLLQHNAFLTRSGSPAPLIVARVVRVYTHAAAHDLKLCLTIKSSFFTSAYISAPSPILQRALRIISAIGQLETPDTPSVMFDSRRVITAGEDRMVEEAEISSHSRDTPMSLQNVCLTLLPSDQALRFLYNQPPKNLNATCAYISIPTPFFNVSIVLNIYSFISASGYGHTSSRLQRRTLNILITIAEVRTTVPSRFYSGWTSLTATSKMLEKETVPETTTTLIIPNARGIFTAQPTYNVSGSIPIFHLSIPAFKFSEIGSIITDGHPLLKIEETPNVTSYRNMALKRYQPPPLPPAVLAAATRRLYEALSQLYPPMPTSFHREEAALPRTSPECTLAHELAAAMNSVLSIVLPPVAASFPLTPPPSNAVICKSSVEPTQESSDIKHTILSQKVSSMAIPVATSYPPIPSQLPPVENIKDRRRMAFVGGLAAVVTAVRQKIPQIPKLPHRSRSKDNKPGSQEHQPHLAHRKTSHFRLLPLHSPTLPAFSEHPSPLTPTK
ncbi:hypothetical protein K439DRAFT_991879 [Ramaria rubella]|nr:hypothetical protein K439DRAFT_991879 [Ramaria rubella]